MNKFKFWSFLTVVLLVLVSVGFVSCSDDEEDDTTYTFICSLSSAASVVQSDVTLFEYNGNGERVATNSIKNVSSSTRKTFTATPSSVKVKVYIRMYTESIERYRWVQTVFYLTKGGNTNIELKDDTVLGSSEP